MWFMDAGGVVLWVFKIKLKERSNNAALKKIASDWTELYLYTVCRVMAS
jgi:hypothetical protein